MNFSIRMLGKQVAICGLLAGTLIACVTPAHDPRITGAPETHPAASALTLAMYAGADKPCVQPLGNLRSLQGWKGLEAKEHGAELRVPGKAFFAYPNGTKGWYNKGFREENDGTADWRDFYGIQLEVNLEGDKQAELVARIKLPDQPARVDYVPETATTITLCGKGWQTVTLPWSSFDFQQAQPAFLKFVQTLELSVRSQGATKADSLLIRSVRLVKGETVSLESMVRGKSAKPGESVEYIATVGNCTKKTQSVNLAIEKHGWEVMPVSVEPAQMLLAPGETKECKVRVTVADRVPAGGTETQKLRVVANGKGDAAATLSFVTASAVPHPNILHTAEEWQEVRDKVQKYEWARKAQDEYIKTANKWKVPEIADPAKIVNTDDTMGPYLFRTQEETGIVASAVSWQLTRNTEHAKKVALFLLRLSDPTKGYPTTFRGCHQSFVQEGHWIQYMAMCYDMILDANVLTEAERAQIEQTFRVYIESVRLSINMGAINNWNVSEFCGALYCSLAMQDMALVDRHLNGPTGILDQMRHGIMNDGWWYECSISYNIWVAREFSQVAIAMRPWGMDLAHAQIPNGYSRNYGLVPWSMQPGLYGMSFEKFGPVTSSYVTLKRMWDALPVFGDYRGIIFGINDTTEKPLGGDAKTNSEAGYEVAYYLFRDPVYANIIKQSGKRDLLYGVPELPKKTPDTSAQSAHADNVGVALLRSQATEARERIQAVLHYGSHGGFHGHFDRTSLLSLMRYGKSFYNPESIWYSYAPFMYKFYVQTSMSNNMVVVDQKMQEPVESPCLLFHTGKLFQATAVETNARWSHPPLGGMRYPEQPAKNLAEKQWNEGRSFPIPADAQPYGELGPYSDRVLQRRAMAVMDDYVVIADSMKAPQEHTYDSLLQIKGFLGLTAAEKKLVRHDGQMNTDGRSAAQFITDCDWYSVQSPARASFNSDGLKMDVISLWPKEQQLMVGAAPEVQPVQKQLTYSVQGDGKTLTDGKFGAWILGVGVIDAPVNGVKTLTLTTTESHFADEKTSSTLFWANARVVTAEGKEIKLSELPLTVENTRKADAGKDYYGGAIKIQGIAYDNAVAAQPLNLKQPAVIKVDLSGINAARFKAVVGGDYPAGDESKLRKTYSQRIQGKEARFLTLIEPFEKASKVASAEASGPDKLRVTLADGRVQEIEIQGLDGDGKNIQIRVVETKDGQITRTESTTAK